MTEELVLKAKGLAELPTVAKAIMSEGKGFDIWLLMGEMGAGKTTLSKALGKVLKVLDEVQSPTFSIVNEYLTEDNTTVYHFDFYRLESVDEAIAMGVQEYFYSGNICWLEWPQKVEAILPERFLRIDIEDTLEGNRTFKISKHG